MIKIVPWADRKLSMKNWRKIWNLFPYGEICMTEIDREWEHQNWAEKIARYYVSRGRKFSVEISQPLLCTNFINNLLLIGVKKFYFHWTGITEIQFISAFELLSYIIMLREEYKDVEFIIVYTPMIDREHGYIRQELIETSISCMAELTKNDEMIKLVCRRPHPFGGNMRIQMVEDMEKYVAKNSIKYECYSEYPCGCITITPNTNIYPCPFCKRKQRKKRFGDALRDKFVIGTIDKGIVREIDCDFCYLQTNNKNVRLIKQDPMKRIKYKEVEGE